MIALPSSTSHLEEEVVLLEEGPNIRVGSLSIDSSPFSDPKEWTSSEETILNTFHHSNSVVGPFVKLNV